MRQRDLIWRIIVLSLLLYALVSFAGTRRELDRAERETLALEQEWRDLQREKDRLAERLQYQSDEEELRRMARERLGLVLPGEILFTFPPRSEG